MTRFLSPAWLFRNFGLHRCWWRMLETKCIGDNFEMLVTVLAIFENNRPKDVTNIEILSLTSKNCHQDKVTIYEADMTRSRDSTSPRSCPKTYPILNFSICPSFFCSDRLRFLSCLVQWWKSFWPSDHFLNFSYSLCFFTFLKLRMMKDQSQFHAIFESNAHVGFEKCSMTLVFDWSILKRTKWVWNCSFIANSFDS